MVATSANETFSGTKQSRSTHSFGQPKTLHRSTAEEPSDGSDQIMKTVAELLSHNGGDDEFSAYDIASTICGCIMLAFCIIGIFGNTVSMFAFSRRQMRSSINVLLTGLSGIDLCVVTIALPSFALNGLNVYLDNPHIQTIGPYVTRYFYPFACISQTSSVWTFMLISIERFVAVCFPLMARDFLTIGRAKASLFAVILTSLLYNVPRFFEYSFTKPDNANSSNLANEAQHQGLSDDDRTTSRSTVHPGNGTIRTDQAVEHDQLYRWLLDNDLYFRVYYTGMFLVTHFLIPFTMLTIFNVCAAFAISRARSYRRKLSSQTQSEHKTTTMMIVIILMFVCCNTLPFVINLLEAVNPELFTHPDTRSKAYLMVDISNTLVVINSASTFVIYYCFSQRYRLITKYLIKGQMRFLTHRFSNTQYTFTDGSQPGMRSRCSSFNYRGGTVSASPSMQHFTNGGRAASLSDGLRSATLAQLSANGSTAVSLSPDSCYYTETQLLPSALASTNASSNASAAIAAGARRGSNLYSSNLKRMSEASEKICLPQSANYKRGANTRRVLTPGLHVMGKTGIPDCVIVASSISRRESSKRKGPVTAISLSRGDTLDDASSLLEA